MFRKQSPSTYPILEDLTHRALLHLEGLRYSRRALSHFEHSWRSLRKLAQEESLPDALSEELVDRFLEVHHVALAAEKCTSFHRHLRRAVEVLTDFATHGAICRRRRKTSASPPLPSALQAAHSQYLAFSTSHQGTRATTLRIRSQQLFSFFGYLAQLGIERASDITASHLSGFLRTRSHLAVRTLATIVDTLRSFLRIGCVLGLLPTDRSSDVPSVRVPSDAKIPSIWSEKDVAALLAAVETTSPMGKRDFAILQLACRLGIRAGDIRSLTLDEIQWPAARIAFAQGKTGGVVELPMSDEIARALIDYLRHGRPPSSQRTVFLRSIAPFVPLGNDNNLYDIITRYRRRAGIELPRASRRGLHSLRHTLATRLLARGVGMEAIAGVLGQQSLESTRIYTKVDIDALRSAALELPGVTL